MHSTEATFTPISTVGEFGLIDRIQAVLGKPADGDILKSIGDDAAVYRIGEGRVHVVTTDALIESVHFDRTFAPMKHLGAKSIGVNVSDIAAMNAIPRFATIALGLPHDVSVEMVDDFYQGMKTACEAYGVALLGGDTTAAQKMTISVTVIGEAREDQVVYRSGARAGDKLCVTGDLGGAFAGLRILLDQRAMLQRIGQDYKPDLKEFGYVIRRQLTPAARMGIVRAWHQAGIQPNALIDISDGLASEVLHLCRNSGVGALLDAKALPIHEETRRAAAHFSQDADTYALYGGEDYELLFTMPEETLARMEASTFKVIGTVTDASEGVRIQTPEGAVIPLENRGYRHFGGGSDAG
ncbi:MAG: thiamine-phosphate kinase [Rhodothermales bacterium]